MTLFNSFITYLESNNITPLNILYTSSKEINLLPKRDLIDNGFFILFFKMSSQEFYNHLPKKWLKNEKAVLAAYKEYYTAIIDKIDLENNIFMNLHKKMNIEKNVIIIWYCSYTYSVCKELHLALFSMDKAN